MSPFDARKKKTLAKLGWVCGLIEDMLAGQDIILKDVELPNQKKPGETMLERFQRFKDLLGQTLAEINRGERRTCQRCHGELPAALLDDMPWIWHCPKCTG